MNQDNCDVVQVGDKLIGYIKRDGGVFKAFLTPNKPPGKIIGIYKEYDRAMSELLRAHRERVQTAH